MAQEKARKPGKRERDLHQQAVVLAPELSEAWEALVAARDLFEEGMRTCNFGACEDELLAKLAHDLRLCAREAAQALCAVEYERDKRRDEARLRGEPADD